MTATSKSTEILKTDGRDWAAVKAAYSFLSNPPVSETGILAGHFEAVRTRVQATAEII